jgi:hypothetical protein
MARTLSRMSGALLVVLMVVVVSGAAHPKQKSKRIRLPNGVGTKVIEGFIGGESIDDYVIRIRAGRTLSLRLSIDEKEKAEGSTASFSVGPGNFGTESDGGMSWEGKVPRTRDYSISVVAHPSAHYSLTVTVK